MPAPWFPYKSPVNPCKHLQCTIALFDINLSSRYAAAYALHSFCQLNNECFSALILKLANRMSCVEYTIICSYDLIGILQKDNILNQKFENCELSYDK